MNYEKKIIHEQKISTLNNIIVDMDITLRKYVKDKQNAYLEKGFSDAGIKAASDVIYMSREKMLNQLKEVLQFLKDDYNEKYKISKVQR